MDDNVRELCAIRDQEKVMILLISALNRYSYNKEISLESFKESGSIEYSADVILGMQYQGIEKSKGKGTVPFSLDDAKNRNPRQLELSLLKMRYGQDGVRIPSGILQRQLLLPRAGGRRTGQARPDLGAAGALWRLACPVSRRVPSKGPAAEGVRVWSSLS